MSWANSFACNAWCYESRADVSARLSENVNKMLLERTFKCLSVSNDTENGSQPYWYIPSKSLSLFWNINNINVGPLTLNLNVENAPNPARKHLERPIWAISLQNDKESNPTRASILKYWQRITIRLISPRDCICPLECSSGVCVGMYGCKYSLYHHRGYCGKWCAKSDLSSKREVEVV